MASGYTSRHGRPPLDKPHGVGDHLTGTPQGNMPRLLDKPCLWMNLMDKPEGHAILRGVWEHLMGWETPLGCPIRILGTPHGMGVFHGVWEHLMGEPAGEPIYLMDKPEPMDKPHGLFPEPMDEPHG